jgi:hypothetical protein
MLRWNALDDVGRIGGAIQEIGKTMTETHTTETKPETPKPGASALPKKKIHRVCISCNYMFEVSVDDFTAKHCPKCHKG